MNKLEECNTRLNKLRQEWKERPLMREIIERQARAVQIQIEMLEKNEQQKLI